MTEVSYFLDMLRSASASEHETSKAAQTSHGEWKLKDDNEEYRVMYRQGPHGTGLHKLLVEGYVDGPVDACLCISWELTLYRKWWPQIIFPPFKITVCKFLQKVRIGEQISLVRVKIMWPLSAREAVVHYFLFEYLKDGLVVVLANTISDLENIDKTTHGFTRDGIPEVKDVVRIDVVGGFAIQKVTTERSYFRTIATMDLKLDFVPPSLINFISRQLIGSGFRLYQKAVASVSSYDEDYSKALEDPMYARIRESLYPIDETNETMEGKELKYDACRPLQQHSTKDMQKSLENMDQKVQRDTKAVGEIEEEESDVSVELENHGKSTSQPLTDKFAQKSPLNGKANIRVSAEVEQALETLEKATSLVRQRGFNSLGRFSSDSEDTPNLQKGAEKDSTFVEDGMSSDSVVSVEVPETVTILERTSHESRNSFSNCDIRRVGSNSYT
ncbi:hypothetical protein MANES_08G036000v8 [Manihot esculenta]|nr:hypothetical protein MANES_08G036000v8 [Manihot esculenta]KAG8648752.1 hypothetical protein MANES_08G036000v8 [Manihot esculenta]